MRTDKTSDDPESASTMARIHRPGVHWEKIVILISLLAFGILYINLNPNPSVVGEFSDSETISDTTTSETINKGYDTTNWAIYKHTTSITPGSAITVSEFVNSYIGYISLMTTLGCSSSKVVSSFLYPYSEDSTLGFYEIHWVDSSVFQTTGTKSIQEWNEYIENLSSEGFNNFMHNKVQLYVSDLQPLATLIRKDSLSAYKHVSSSKGSNTLDVAHIGLVVKDAAMVYEIVGPSSSLMTSLVKEEYSEWSTEECPSAHLLPQTLDFYEETYKALTPTDEQKAWMDLTGLNLPMAIRITIPTSSLTYVKSTTDLIQTITNASYSVFTDTENNCNLASLGWDGSSDYFNPEVTYVENNNNNQADVSDWEEDVSNTHLQRQANSSWDRYIDTHIGIAVDDSDLCLGNMDFIEDSITSNAGNFMYSLRESKASHYYVGNKGLRSWEFNAVDCMKQGVEICGCISSNNNYYYLLATGSACTINSTVEII